MDVEVILVDEHSTRAELERAIAARRAEQERLPKAWEDKREDIAQDIERMVIWWLAAKA